MVGIDPATETGIARGEPGKIPKLAYKDFRVLKEDSHELLFQRALTWWATECQRNPPGAVFIEAPIPPTKIKSDDGSAATNFYPTLMAFGLYGILVSVTRANGIPLYKANIRAWRAAFYGEGNGNITKKESKQKARQACEILGWDHGHNHNAAESGGIWAYGVMLLVKKKLVSGKLAPPLWRLKPLFEGSDAA